MDSNFQFRDASPPGAPSFGGEWRLLEPPQQLYRFPEADDSPRMIRRADDRSTPTRTKPRNRCLSRAELKVRIHSPPAESRANHLFLSGGAPSLVIVDSKITGITHANMKPSTTKIAPRDRAPVTSAVIAGRPQATPGAHETIRRRQRNTPPPLTRQRTATANSMSR